MKNRIIQYLISFGLIGSFDVAAKEKFVFDEISGSIWTLSKNASQSRLRGDGQVLYFLSGDAYHTERARRFQEWDSFAFTDVRNLEYLIKGDQIQLLEPMFSDRVLKVKLLSGSQKNKNFYIITDELFKNFIQSEESNEAS
jgi:hypothetical protein